MKTSVVVETTAVETPSLTGEVIGETHGGLECAQAHPLGNQHQRGPISLWVAEGVTETQQRVEQAPLLPLGPAPTYSITAVTSGTPPRKTPKAPPLYLTGAPRPKKMAQMKQQIKAPEIIQLSSEQIANLSDAQFKTLVIKMLTELVEFVRKLDEKMKPMPR